MARAKKADTPAEKLLREAMSAGRPLDLRIGDEQADDPSHGEEWDARRTVSAELLTELLLSADASRPRPLRLTGARIAGQLDLQAAQVFHPFLMSDCWFEKAVILSEANLPVLRLPGCHLPSFLAEQLTTRGNLDLAMGFTAGKVNLDGAHVGGRLSFVRATLNHPGETVLRANRVKVDQEMDCRRLVAEGEISLIGAQIGGYLIFEGATLTNPEGFALFADGLMTGQDLFFRRGFTARGQISLNGARIGGQLGLNGSTLNNPDGTALNADGVKVDQPMFCTELKAQGEIRLVGAEIGGQLTFTRASLGTRTGIALDLQQLRTSGLILRALEEAPERIDLVHAQVDTLVDDVESWPHRISLRGFTYDYLVEDSAITAHQRLDWLGRDPKGYSPQPYEQLVAVYRRAGRDQDARAIAIAKQRVHRRSLSKERGRRRILALPTQAWSLILDGLIGYGYRTWLAVFWLVGFVLTGWWAFDRAYDSHLLIAGKSPRPPFHSAMYALDLLLPFVDLGFQSSWIPKEWAQTCFLGWNLVGWILITAVVAALGGLIKRD